MQTLCSIALGSNLGDRPRILFDAVQRLELYLGSNLNLSRMYETEPRMDLDQPPFLNAVATVSCTQTPRELLVLLQRVEEELGRKRSSERPKGPRTLDLDLLLVGNEVVSQPDLVVPHPGLALRRFVLAPLAELVPNLVPPGQTQPAHTVAELLAQCPDEGWVQPLSLSWAALDS